MSLSEIFGRTPTEKNFVKMKNKTKNKKKVNQEQMPVEKVYTNQLKAKKSRHWRQPFAMVILLICTWISFYPSLRNGFVNWDDPIYILNNDLIKTFSWQGVKNIFTNFNSDNYAPLSDLTSALEYKIFGPTPKGFHFFSLFFHIINTLLVFTFIRLLTTNPNISQHAGNIGVAFITALLFGVHPMQVESVAWASAQSTLLYSVFFLGGMISYLYYLKENRVKKYYFIALLFFTLSLLAKGMALVFPLALFLIDFYKERKFTWKVILEKVPFLILSTISGLLTIWLKKNAGAIADMTVFPILHRILFACYGFVSYIIKFFVPFDLSAYYPYPYNPIVDPGHQLPIFFYISPFIVISIFFVCFRYLRRSKTPLFGILFYFINLLLVLQFITVGSAIMADRYSYLPYVGLFLIISKGYSYAMEHITPQRNFLKLFISGLLICFIIMLAGLTFKRTFIWKNDISLFTDNISKFPSSTSYKLRANARINEEDYEGAIADFDQAIKLKPFGKDVYKLYQNRGVAKEKLNNHKGALEDYDTAIEINSTVDGLFALRANVKEILQDYKGALEDYDKAIKQDPTNENLYNSSGIIRGKTGDFNNAIIYFTRAINLNSNLNSSYSNRGFCYLELKKVAEACNDFKKSSELGNDAAKQMFLKYCK